MNEVQKYSEITSRSPLYGVECSINSIGGAAGYPDASTSATSDSRDSRVQYNTLRYDMLSYVTPPLILYTT